MSKSELANMAHQFQGLYKGLQKEYSCRVEKSLFWEDTGFLAAISLGLRHGRLGYYKKYSSLNTSCI